MPYTGATGGWSGQVGTTLVANRKVHPSKPLGPARCMHMQRQGIESFTHCLPITVVRNFSTSHAISSPFPHRGSASGHHTASRPFSSFSLCVQVAFLFLPSPAQPIHSQYGRVQNASTFLIKVVSHSCLTILLSLHPHWATHRHTLPPSGCCLLALDQIALLQNTCIAAHSSLAMPCPSRGTQTQIKALPGQWHQWC